MHRFKSEKVLRNEGGVHRMAWFWSINTLSRAEKINTTTHSSNLACSTCAQSRCCPTLTVNYHSHAAVYKPLPSVDTCWCDLSNLVNSYLFLYSNMFGT